MPPSPVSSHQMALINPPPPALRAPQSHLTVLKLLPFATLRQSFRPPGGGQCVAIGDVPTGHRWRRPKVVDWRLTKEQELERRRCAVPSKSMHGLCGIVKKNRRKTEFRNNSGFEHQQIEDHQMQHRLPHGRPTNAPHTPNPRPPQLQHQPRHSPDIPASGRPPWSATPRAAGRRSPPILHKVYVVSSPQWGQAHRLPGENISMR